MKERIMIEGKSRWAKRKAFVIVLFVLAILVFVSAVLYSLYCEKKADALYDDHHTESREYNTWSKRYTWYTTEDKDWKDYEEEYESLRRTSNTCETIGEISMVSLLPLSVVLLVIYLIASKTRVTVTDKRVVGRAAFRKRVELPIDCITAVGTAAFRTISIGTSSGRIRFCAIESYNEICDTIITLLMERQNAYYSLAAAFSGANPKAGAGLAFGSPSEAKETESSSSDEHKKAPRPAPAPGPAEGKTPAPPPREPEPRQPQSAPAPTGTTRPTPTGEVPLRNQLGYALQYQTNSGMINYLNTRGREGLSEENLRELERILSGPEENLRDRIRAYLGK